MPEQNATEGARDDELAFAARLPITTSNPVPPSPPPPITPANQIQKKSALEKASLAMGMVVPVVLGWATWNLTNQQWQSQQRQYQNTVQEQDRNRVLDRLLALGNSSMNDRLIAAKALRSYADMNRMDVASLAGLLPYLKSECDETVFRIEKEAALQAARNSTPQASNGATAVQQPVAGIAAIERSSQCPNPTNSGATASPTATVITAPPQYFEVGCNNEKMGTLEVPTPSAISGTQMIQSVSATLANIDNLKEWSVRVLGHTERSATVEYRLVGLDRQFLGNCPGGGHGSVVTSFVIGPK